MSVNTLDCEGDSFRLLPGENILTEGNTADIELRVPPTVQGPKRKEAARGRLWVTDQRVVFMADPSPASSSRAYDAPPELSSIVVPYPSILSTTFELPILSQNYILISFLPAEPVEASGLPPVGRGGKIELKVAVGEGAGHGIWKRIEGERMMAEERSTEEEALPAYTPAPDAAGSAPVVPPRP